VNSEQTLTINEKKVSFTPGQTLLEVARENGIDIPTLCYLDRCEPTGSCRICLVEVKGARALVASCAMPAAPGMEVQTESEAVVKARRMVIELLLASGEHNCMTCEANGECKLQDLAYRYQVETIRFSRPMEYFPMESSNPLIIRDFSKCVLCGRCVQACNEIQVNLAISFGYRGARSKIVTKGDVPLEESDCVFCGECVGVCPVGALVEKKARYKGRPWEETKIKTTCSYCGVGCQVYLHVKDGQVLRVTGVEDGLPNLGSLCVKGKFGHEFIHSKERLTTPLIRQADGFRHATWDEALDYVAKRLKEIKEKDGPDSLAGLSSASVTNEENYLMQKLVRAGFGTNNVDHCARLCHASTVTGLATVFGSGAMTNSIAEIEDADVILVIGSNTTETHPVISTFVKRATLGKAKLIVADPRKITLTNFSEVWLRQRPGTDVALINGMINVILSEGLQDQAFIDDRTENFEDLKKAVAEYPPEKVEKITGVPAPDLIEAARIYAKAEKASILYAMGITQHTSGTDNVKALANLAMVTGNLGRPSTGVNPLRGQNNVQGACDMGALPNVYSGYQSVTDPAVKEKFEQAWGVSLPDQPGLTVVEITNAIDEGRIKGLYIMGENPLISDPDVNHVEQVLKKCEFLVVQDIFLTETARLADVVLPGTSFAEKEGTFTNTERRVSRVRQAVQPVGEARGDLEILNDLASRLGLSWTADTAEAVMAEIAALTPSYAGISYPRLEGNGLIWPCLDKDHPGTPILHVSQFTRGLGLFTPVEHREPAEPPSNDYPFTLTTGRILYQYHTGSMSRRCEPLDYLAPRCEVEINPADAAELSISDGDGVMVSSRRGEIVATARVTDIVPAKVIFIPFHYAEAAANRLTIAELDPVAKIPEFKVCAAKLEKVEEAETGEGEEAEASAQEA